MNILNKLKGMDKAKLPILMSEIDRIKINDFTTSYNEQFRYLNALKESILGLNLNISLPQEKTFEVVKSHNDYANTLGREIDKSLELLKEFYLMSILNYFRDELNEPSLGSYSHKDSAFKDINEEKILNFIAEKIKTRDFESYKLTGFLIMFANDICKCYMRENHYTQKGNSVSFSSVFNTIVPASYEKRVLPYMHYDYAHKVNFLYTVLSYFEFGTFEDKTGFSTKRYDYADLIFDKEINLPSNFAKVKSLKFFKNGKITVNFHNAQSTHEFSKLIEKAIFEYESKR